jgi:hypothetical protein
MKQTGPVPINCPDVCAGVGGGRWEEMFDDDGGLGVVIDANRIMGMVYAIARRSRK